MSELTFRSDPPPSDDADLVPVPFSLVVWRRSAGKKPVEETHSFDCLPRSEVSGHKITKVYLSTDRGDVAVAAEAWRFFELVMDHDDVVRLDALLNEDTVYVDQGVLIEAAVELFGVYAGRPTRPQRRSAAGQKATRARTSGPKRG